MNLMSSPNRKMRNWHYFNPVRVIFAPGALSQLADHVPYQRAVLVTTPGFTRRGVVDRIRHYLGDRIIKVLDDVKPNPDLLDIDAQARPIRRLNPDCIIALGGGSSMDSAKALARLLTQPATTTLTAHFRDGKSLTCARAVPLIAIPTTAGTGAEVTPFGTVWDFENGKKYSVTGDDIYSAVAVLDPDLTISLPEEVTISSGLDAVSHALESTWNKNANPVTLGLSAKSLQLSLSALPRLKESPRDVGARTRMMQASLLAGLAISQTRTALAHSISYPLTATFGLPHGVACSFALPALLRFNLGADRDGLIASVSSSLGYASPQMLAEALQAMFHKLAVSKMMLRHFENLNSIRDLQDRMINPERAQNNIREADIKQVGKVIDAAISDLCSPALRITPG
jgi:alcohol dehydrogenase